MNKDGLFWLAAGSMVATCFASLGARCLRHFSRRDLEEICRKRMAQDLFGEILRRHERTALAAELLATPLGTMATVAAIVWIGLENPLASGFGWGTLLSSVLVLGVCLAAAKIWLPWAFAQLFAEPFLFHTWRIWKVATAIATPLLWGATAVDVVLHRITGRMRADPTEESLEEEIRTIVSVGHREGLLEEDAREMIEGVIELGDADVAEVMTPRTDMHMLQVDTPWDDLVVSVIESGHTRIPIFDDNRDDILGVLYSKDLLPELAKTSTEPRTPLRDLVRRPLFVPETKAVDDLLEMFQHTHTHIAVVLDEYGGVAGLVTIEDVLEEIVGEIVDEYDEEVAVELHRVNETTWESAGRLHVDEINAAIDLDLPEDGDFDTIAGFVFTELGHVPQNGESIVWNDRVRLTVIEATRRRIERVRIEYVDQDARDIA